MRRFEMKLTVLPLLFLFAVAVAHPASDVNRATLNQNFDVKAGNRVVIQNEGLNISFLTVSEDSRCPENAKCVWSGNAKVVLRLSKAGQRAATINLNTGLDPKNISYQGYDIKLIDVSPHRKTDAAISKGDYAVTLLVTKK
jgi:hypothetical protein